MNVKACSRVLVREIAAEDEAEFIELARASVDMHRPWIFMPTSSEAFATYVSRFDRLTAIGLVVCLRSTGAIVGVVNLRQMRRADAHEGTIGFGAFSGTAGRGYIREGVELALHFAFGRLELRRVQADIQPGNTACLHLVRRLGFRWEGPSVALIWIDGAWREHERWAITREMFVPVSWPGDIGWQIIPPGSRHM